MSSVSSFIGSILGSLLGLSASNAHADEQTKDTELVQADSLPDLADAYSRMAKGLPVRTLHCLIFGDDRSLYFGRPGSGVYLVIEDGRGRPEGRRGACSYTTSVILRACSEHDATQNPTAPVDCETGDPEDDSWEVMSQCSNTPKTRTLKGEHTCDYDEGAIGCKWRTIRLTHSGGATLEKGTDNWNRLRPPYDAASLLERLKDTLLKVKDPNAWTSNDGEPTAFTPTASQAAEIAFFSRPDIIESLVEATDQARKYTM